jgi:chemotaxis protein methyltransferase CheR
MAGYSTDTLAPITGRRTGAFLRRPAFVPRTRIPMAHPMSMPEALPSSDAQAREFSFDARDFQRVRELIHQRAGISLHEHKQAMVYSRLSRRLRDTGHRSFGSYLQWLEAAAGEAAEGEWQQFVNCLTTNLTAFFREEHHFPVLHEALRALGTGSPVRIWCNAASTGEEPYSLAMCAVEALGANAPIKIIASDIDTTVLNTARRGVYAADARGLSAERLKRHFMRGTGANAGFVRVRPDLQKLIEFRAFNLMSTHWALGESFDVVFCRNVMIYFDAPTQRRVLERIHAVMRPNGHLFVGHSENFTDSRDLFLLRGKTVYQRA